LAAFFAWLDGLLKWATQLENTEKKIEKATDSRTALDIHANSLLYHRSTVGFFTSKLAMENKN